MHFSDDKERARFLGWLRSLADDLHDFAAAASILIAANRRSDDAAFVATLNAHAPFWNSVLLSAQTTAIVVMGRIHDNGRDAYLKGIVRVLGRYGPTSGEVALAQAIAAAVAANAPLLEKVEDLRNKLFAHSSAHRQLYISFGFEGLTWDHFESYWADVSRIATELERHVLGENYGPRFEPEALRTEVEGAQRLFDSLRP
jgi:hypothetical protein